MANDCGLSRLYSALYISIFLLYLITFTAANCDDDTNGLYRFGPDCRFLCHCMNTEEQCHDTTGECTTGCGFEWVGPGCQYNNIAEGRGSRHLDNKNPAMYSDLANNNDNATCSKTNTASATRKVAPWWRVFLPYKATIRGLEFITLTESIQYFGGFNVSVETIPKSKFENSAYYPETQQLCYNHIGTVPGSTTITAKCATEHVGNQVRIQLTSTATQLVLCDVRIYGGRNLAIGGLATQSTSDSANEAVDGITSSCSITAQESNPWWSIDLRRIMRIDSIEILPYTDGSIRYYHVSVSNDSTTWSRVHTDSPHTEVEVHAIAQHLQIGMSGDATLGVCEVRVFGDCQENMCGYDCTKKCYCKNSVISVEDRMMGICTSGCLGRWTGVGEQCDIECTYAQWGQSCESQCGNCYASAICDVITGECPAGCDAGYMNTLTCTTECTDGQYGWNCMHSCSGRCINNDVCRKTDGHCVNGCSPGYMASTCDQICANGNYGGGCSKSCGVNCQRAGGSICDHVNGTCLQGCKPGWDGAYCDTACQSGSWGQACKTGCGHCSEGPCNAVNGECDTGCSAGYKTTLLCTTECTNGSYGNNCTGACSTSCVVAGSCNHVDGNCNGCQPGWQGTLCDQECNTEMYGEQCMSPCGSCADDGTCNHVTGHCNLGCSPGFKHSDLCQEACEENSHGVNCSCTCGNCKVGTGCDKVTGICLEGCADEFTGDTCIEASPQGPSVAAVLGGVAAAIVIIAVLVAVLQFLRIRKQRQQKDSNSITEYDTVINSDSERRKKLVKRSEVYVNSTELQAELNTSRESAYNRSNDVEDSAGIYYNQGPFVRQKTEYEFLIVDLEAYVTKSLANTGYLEKQFQTIPYGLHHPTKVARKPGNAGKNRYKAMYAYDHSRVVLEILEDKPASDYINASYIKGHFKDKAYIAAQGPVETNMNDFWRMIWEKDVHMIAMTTNLMEETKMKCMQYWPKEADTSMLYGLINVTMESEDVFAEFTIRYLRVYHQDRPNVQRNIIQYHYTAWPDKDVPRSTSSLLQFWYKVRKNDANKMNMWLVHCSAGVGRTGTFLAIDILYDQGKDHGSVDVYQCVTDLREQRVNMVQTKEQYKYLHNAMVEVLVLPSDPVSCDDFHKVHKDLTEIDANTGKTKMWMQYQAMLGKTNGANYTEEDDDIYSSANTTENIHKNRYDDILAMDEFRPWLYTHVTGCSNYINAVYIPSYRDSHGFIITQTPLKNTAVDCCRLVYEQEVKVIVTFDDKGNEEVGTYLPATGSVRRGPFTITLISEQEMQHFTKRTHLLNYNSKDHTITQFEFKHWPSAKATPTDASKMLEFLQEIESAHRQTDNTPIIAQCLNGAEKSGLIVVMMNILERARFETEVSIAQVIRQLRIRSPQIIPNVEQFKFCHDVLLSYAESNATYANT